MKFPAPEVINPLPVPGKSSTKARICRAFGGGLTLKSKRASVPEAGGNCKHLLKKSAKPQAENV
jgi:hypothetical protein